MTYVVAGLCAANGAEPRHHTTEPNGWPAASNGLMHEISRRIYEQHI